MAKMNLLNTDTVNLLQLLGNGRIYKVPPYQRDYSWEEEQWEDLWNDILELREKRDDRHYMGTLVVEAKSDREFLIIDGQQRLATLSILALAVIALLRSMADRGLEDTANRERAQGLRNRFIGEKDPASLIESSKLFLNETDNAFYQDYLVQLRKPLKPRGLCKSNKLLWECFQYFWVQILHAGPSANGSELAELLSETVARQLMFILITVDDELNAYTVFETLNARGLELSSTDLLKNYLFSRVRVASDLSALQRRWRSLITTIQQEHFPEFLRYHLLCQQPKVRNQRLFKLVRAEVKTPEEVFALMESLEPRAELFAALSDPQHSYWIDNRECQPIIRELNLFRVRQMTPLLFAAWETLPKLFAQVLKIVSVISFRYIVVGRQNPNALEILYHNAAKAILDGKATSLKDIFHELRSVYVSDEKFEQDFELLDIETSGQRKKLVKYVLARLESDASGRECNPDTDPGTIEHILPENPVAKWEAIFPPEYWESYVYRLGNLTLLEPSTNRSIGNSTYDEKTAAYSQSKYALTLQLPESAPEQWTPELLNERQRRLAKRAVHVWRINY